MNYPLEDGTAFEQFEKVNMAPVIMVMGKSDQNIAIGATKGKADSYVIKDPQGNYLKTLPLFLESAIKQKKDDQEAKRLRKHLRHLEKLAEERIVEMQKEVDECKKTGEQLEIFHCFAEAYSQGICIATVHGIITYCNPALAEILGEEKPDDAVGKSLFVYYPVRIRQRLKNEILPTVLREGQWVGELGLLRTNSDFIPYIENCIFAIRDKNGTPLYLTNVLKENTEQKRADEALKRLHNTQSTVPH
jgi:PAS domain S-box-containing protein